MQIHYSYIIHIFQLKLHMSIHSKDRPFECSICFKTFKRECSSSCILNRHTRTHTDELLFVCSKCGHRFENEVAKQSHVVKCKCRLYKCHLCQYDCFRVSSLVRRIKYKHTGERLFNCEICRKNFVSKYTLDKHMARHVEQFPFQCRKCRRGFSEEYEKCAHESVSGYR